MSNSLAGLVSSILPPYGLVQKQTNVTRKPRMKKELRRGMERPRVEVELRVTACVIAVMALRTLLVLVIYGMYALVHDVLFHLTMIECMDTCTRYWYYMWDRLIDLRFLIVWLIHRWLILIGNWLSLTTTYTAICGCVIHVTKYVCLFIVSRLLRVLVMYWSYVRDYLSDRLFIHCNHHDWFSMILWETGKSYLV